LKRSLIPSLVVILASVWVFALPPGTNDEISERLTPFGSVCRAGDDCGAVAASAASGPLSGQQVYDQFCFACHTSGVGGAPLFGDAAAWEPRVAKGLDELMASTLNGINAMPAKGTCMNCSDDELSAAVDYMIEQTQ
jgi:cytochrome c5